MTKLPVLATVGEAYAFVWRERRRFWRLALPAIIVLALFGSVTVWLLDVAIATRGEGTSPLPDLISPEEFSRVLRYFDWATDWIAWLIYVVAWLVFALSWHRQFLIRGYQATVTNTYRWGWQQTWFLVANVKVWGVVAVGTYLGWYIVGYLLVWGPNATDRVLPETIESNLAYILTAFDFFVLGWLYALLSMFLPAAALDIRPKYRDVLKLVSGNVNRLLFVVAFAMAPLLAITYGVDWVVGAVFETSGLYENLTTGLILALLYTSLTFVTDAVLISSLSASYKFLTDAYESPAP